MDFHEMMAWFHDQGYTHDLGEGFRHLKRAADALERIAVAVETLALPPPDEVRLADRPPDDRPPEEYPPAGTLCSVCHTPQYRTPGGACCKNGHGGADALDAGVEADESRDDSAGTDAEWEAL